jgi:transcriptional repressor NrdR
MLVIKKDGRREPFSREKILRGLQRACEKRPVEASAIAQLADRIEGRVQDQGLIEVPTALIGEWTMDELRELDQIAYVRFASVYRSFADVGELRDMLDEFDGPAARAPREQLTLLNETTLDELREPAVREPSRLIQFQSSTRRRGQNSSLNRR